MAYSSSERQSGSQAAHPGEGTRSAPLEQRADAPEPLPFRPQHTQEHPDAANDVVIGANEPRAIHHTLPSAVGVPPPTRRYQPPPGEPMPRRQLPKIYDRHPLFGYWYVPVAAVVAILVAVSVIWAFGKLLGDDDASDPGQATPAATSSPPAQQTPTTAASAAPTTPAARPSTGAGKFTGGDVLLVTGTGDCLNVRVRPGRDNDAIVCLKDGAEVRVTGGPETAGELTWWKVQTELGEGWAAEDYLVKKP